MPIGSLAGGTALGKEYMVPQAVQDIPDSGAEYKDGTADIKSDRRRELFPVSGTEDRTAVDQMPDKQAKPNEQLKKAVDTLNKQIDNSEAIFGIHEETKRITIKIVDKDTKKTIKEFPPEKALDLLAKAWEMAGILIDEKR